MPKVKKTSKKAQKKIPTIKVLVVDDHRIVREGIRSSLSHYPFIKIVGEAADGREALRKVETLLPDIALMDIDMPRMDGLTAIGIISKKFPKTRVITLTMHENKDYVLLIVRAGGKGYVLKDTSSDQLARAIRSVHQGEAFFSPSVSRVLQEYIQSDERPKPRVTLTDREIAILSSISAGKTTKEIATQLNLSDRTIETYRARIRRKIHARNTAEMMKYAVENFLHRF
ncbi:MAG: putative NarL family two-component response regulator [Verrucomicrobiales bacterium]|nr:putative NarL family two-component response regulator [Verrucomicrobiales bacterium]